MQKRINAGGSDEDEDEEGSESEEESLGEMKTWSEYFGGDGSERDAEKSDESSENSD